VAYLGDANIGGKKSFNGGDILLWCHIAPPSIDTEKIKLYPYNAMLAIGINMIFIADSFSLYIYNLFLFLHFCSMLKIHFRSKSFILFYSYFILAIVAFVQIPKVFHANYSIFFQAIVTKILSSSALVPSPRNILDCCCCCFASSAFFHYPTLSIVLLPLLQWRQYLHLTTPPTAGCDLPTRKSMQPHLSQRKPLTSGSMPWI